MDVRILNWLGVILLGFTAVGICEDSVKMMPFSVKDTAMEPLVLNYLRQFDVNVALESFPVTTEQAISYDDALKELGKRKPESLNERELHWLKMAKEIREKEPEKLHYKFHYYQKRFDLRIDKQTSLIKVLEAAVALDNRYQVRTSGRHIAVVPKVNGYQKENSVRFSEIPVREAINQFEKEVLKPNGLGFMFISTGPGPSWFQSDRKVSLEVVKASLYDALHQFSDVAGDNLTWEIAGYRSGRHVSIRRFK